jgi:SAM-dependent methyltransferase
MRVIALLKPTSVLEIGCGNGVNLFVLAGRFPEIRFTGIELTEGGVAALNSVRALNKVSDTVRQFSPEPMADPSPFKRIAVLRGNAAALPFRNRSFDLVFTSLALEQMEEIRVEALGEIRRVARTYTAMVEPFREWNESGSQRDYIIANDYFSGRIADLPGVGLEPLLATVDMPTKLTFRPGLVVCRVR